VDGQAIISVSAAVVALTQLIKWAGVNDRLGPLFVMLLSVVGVVFWGYAEGSYERAKAFEYFAGWIAVATSAAGVFGFTRAASDAVVRGRSVNPFSAGDGATQKMRQRGDHGQ
jgi:hypothetical protein